MHYKLYYHDALGDMYEFVTQTLHVEFATRQLSYNEYATTYPYAILTEEQALLLKLKYSNLDLYAI